MLLYVKKNLIRKLLAFKYLCNINTCVEKENSKIKT